MAQRAKAARNGGCQKQLQIQPLLWKRIDRIRILPNIRMTDRFARRKYRTSATVSWELWQLGIFRGALQCVGAQLRCRRRIRRKRAPIKKHGYQSDNPYGRGVPKSGKKVDVGDIGGFAQLIRKLLKEAEYYRIVENEGGKFR